MINYKIKFVTEDKGEETVAEEFNVTIHQYMRFLGLVRKTKGVR